MCGQISPSVVEKSPHFSSSYATHKTFALNTLMPRLAKCTSRMWRSLAQCYVAETSVARRTIYLVLFQSCSQSLLASFQSKTAGRYLQLYSLLWTTLLRFIEPPACTVRLLQRSESFCRGNTWPEALNHYAVWCPGTGSDAQASRAVSTAGRSERILSGLGGLECGQRGSQLLAHVFWRRTGQGL